MNFRMGLLHLGISIFVFCIFPLGVWGDESRAKFIPHSAPGNPKIRWEIGNPRVQSSGNGDKGTVYFVTLRGVYPNIRDEMIYDGKKIKRLDKGKFTFDVNIYSEKRQFSFISVDQHGIIYKYDGEIRFPEWTKYVQWKQFYASQKRWTFTPSVSGSSISFKQTGYPSLSEMALTAKIALAYAITPKKWDVGISAYFTALPISSSTGTTIQFLGVNLRSGFALKSEGSWRARIMTGWYYITSIVPGQAFGFQNVGGPLLFPTVDFSLSSKIILGFYGKYSPIIGGVSFIQPSNKEIAFGSELAFKVGARNYLKIAVDISMLQLAVLVDTINVDTYNFGIGYSF